MVEAVARALGAQGVRGVRALGLLLAAAAAAIALWHLPARFEAANGDASRNAALSGAERRLLPARSVDVDTAVFAAARSLIPVHDTYTVVTGPGIRVSTPVTLDAVGPLAAYYLAPRPQVDDPKLALWIVSYGGDPVKLGVPLARVVQVEPGVEIAQVRR